jgi:sugar/nucleoside kinase (ribokinase family)
VPTLLVVGAASRDLDPSDPRGWRLGGGVTYGSLAARRLGLAVRALAGVDAEAEGARELDLLRDEGVEVQTVRLARGPVFDNGAMPDGRRRQIVHQASDPVPAAALPSGWGDTPAMLLNPVAGEIGTDWVEVLPDHALVALGWQGLLRRLSAGRPVEHLPARPHPLIARADLALVSTEDAVAGGEPLRVLLPRHGQELVISHGPLPALHFRRTGADVRARLLPVTPAGHITDATGAGDILLATWVSARAALAADGETGPPSAALRLALAAASLSVERDGLAAVPSLADLRLALKRPA